MKKFLSLMLCAALTLCAFAAHAENAELNIATNQYYALMERMEQFEQESGISITLRKVRRHHGHDFDRLRYQESRH